MYILATFPTDAVFERRVVRALGHRGHVVAVCSGANPDKVRNHNPDKQVAVGLGYLLWWDPPGSVAPEPMDSETLLRKIAKKP